MRATASQIDRVVDAIAPVRGQVVVEERRHLERQPRGDVDAVGDGAHRTVLVVDARPDGRPHVARHLAVQLADAVDEVGGAQRERRHVEERPAAVVVVAEREERVAVGAERAPRAGEVRLDQAERERVVSGRHRRVRGEDRRPAHRVERRFERRAALDLIADALQDDERRVSFVQVPGRRLDAHGLEDADAADAEDDLLLDARLAVAAVEPRRELAIPGRVLLEIGVEEEEPDAAEPHLPDRHEHGAIPERHGDDAGAAVGPDGWLDRRIGPVEALVDFLLPAFRRHRLMEVALRVHEADADERNPEVARFLAVIAGEHAEAAGVDRQRLMERELGGEVGDRAVRVGVAAVPPRVPRRARRRRAPRSRRRRGAGTTRPAPAARGARAR